MPLNMTLNNPCPRRAIPIITTMAPVILLIHRIVLRRNLSLKRLTIHEIQNQYVTEPALTDIIIGATCQVCGVLSASPKKAKRVNITNIAMGLDRPIATA